VSDRELYDVLDYILNRATTGELDGIRAALRRREEEPAEGSAPSGRGPMGIDVRKLAKQAAEEVQDQVGVSREGMHEMVERLARSVIERDAAELDEGQTKILVDEWLRTSKKDASEAPPAAELPAEVLRTMLGQFVTYSTGAMTLNEEMSLIDAIPEWHSRYWERFPPSVRRLTTLFLKGTIASDEFWRGIDDALPPDRVETR